MNWTTNVKESTMFRVTKPSPRLYSASNTMSGFSNVNQDEGDLNFHRGLVMDRSDFLTEMDVNFGKNFGFRASAAAWWDPIYNQRTNYLNSPNANATIPYFFPYSFCNALNHDCGHFAAGTKELEFLQAELLDAFVHARIKLGSMSLNLRGGQFAQQWGQTLFFGGNGIAGAMSPVDISKLLMVPNAEFKEIIRPVPQISANLQINPKLSIAAYYQLLWEGDRFPSVGSYFSSGDTLGAGAQSLAFPNVIPASIVPNFGGVPGSVNGVPQGAGYLLKLPDYNPKNSGQFGVAITWEGPHGYDFGLYAAQFHEKGPQIVAAPGLDAMPYIPGVMGSDNAIIGAYKLVYQQGIQTLGMSVSKTVGLVNYAAEVSGRRRQDLPISLSVANSFDKNNNPAYPLGDTVHANFSALATLPRTSLVKEGSFLAEVAWNHLVSVTHAADWYRHRRQSLDGERFGVHGRLHADLPSSVPRHGSECSGGLQLCPVGEVPAGSRFCRTPNGLCQYWSQLDLPPGERLHRDLSVLYRTSKRRYAEQWLVLVCPDPRRSQLRVFFALSDIRRKSREDLIRKDEQTYATECMEENAAGRRNLPDAGQLYIRGCLAGRGSSA
jgi:hypothetical protein